MKYKISDSEEDCKVFNGHKLHRIIALENLGHVKCGDKGGFIEKKENLSQDGRAWVSDDAKVYGKATVRDNAQVIDNSTVFNHAIISGDSKITCCSNVSGFAIVSGCSLIKGFAKIDAHARIGGYAVVGDHSRVTNYALVGGMATIQDNAFISGHSEVFDAAFIAEEVIVTGDAKVSGSARLIGDAFIRDISDYIVFKNWWSSGRNFTWTRSNNMYKVGCFYGSGEDLIKKAYRDSQVSGDNYKAIVDYVNNVVLKIN